MQELAEGTTSSRKDLLAYLLTAPSEDGLAMADEVIQDNIITLLLAGHDSTSSALALVLKYLHLHPHCLSELIQGACRPALQFLTSVDLPPPAHICN